MTSFEASYDVRKLVGGGGNPAPLVVHRKSRRPKKNTLALGTAARVGISSLKLLEISQEQRSNQWFPLRNSEVFAAYEHVLPTVSFCSGCFVPALTA